MELETVFDESVSKPLELTFCREGEIMSKTATVDCLHSLTPNELLECGGGSFHAIPYHTAKQYFIPVRGSGVYVANAGFCFGECLVAGSVITSVNDEVYCNS